MDAEEARRAAAESALVQQRFFEAAAEQVVEVGRRIAVAFRAGGKLLVFGNGGSAADCQHFVGELVGRFQLERRGLPAVALTTDGSILTAVGNDLGYDQVFRRQIDALGRAGDVAFGISTSGRSANVVEALRLARERGLFTVGLSGGGGGRLPELVDRLLDVPSRNTQRIQEAHGLAIHVLCQVIEEELAGA
jgi:D-sedoheptulose 7-phosphate isomerase